MLMRVKDFERIVRDFILKCGTLKHSDATAIFDIGHTENYLIKYAGVSQL